MFFNEEWYIEFKKRSINSMIEINEEMILKYQKRLETGPYSRSQKIFMETDIIRRTNEEQMKESNSVFLRNI